MWAAVAIASGDGAPDHPDLANDPFTGWQEAQLPSCGWLLRKEMPSMGDWARLVVIIPRGDDPHRPPGLAHLVEHLDLARGDERERAELEARGVELNGETFPTFTTYYVEAPSSAMPEAAQALLGRVFGSSPTTEAQVDVEREPLRVEKGLPTLAPGWWTWDAVPRFVYGEDFELARSWQTLSASEVDDFRRQWNVPRQATFLVVGDLEAVPVSVFDDLAAADCDSPMEATDPLLHKSRSPLVQYAFDDGGKDELRVTWHVERPDHRDYALSRLAAWILALRLQTELRDRRHVVYTALPFTDLDRGGLEFGVRVRIDDDHREESWAVVQQEVARLASADLLPEDEWQVDRAGAVGRMTRPTTASRVVAAVQEVAQRRGARPLIPPAAPLAAAVDHGEFTAWFAHATRNEQTSWKVTRGVPRFREWVAGTLLAGSAALVGLGQLALRRRTPGTVRGVRWLGRPLGGWVALAAVAVLAGVAWPWLDDLDDRLWRTARDTGVGPVAFLALVNGPRAALTAAAVCLASLLPRDLLEGDGHLVVRTFGAHRWSFAAGDVVEVRRERLVDLLRRGRFRFRVVPWPSPWSVGTSVVVRDGGVVLLHGDAVERAVTEAVAATSGAASPTPP